MKNDDVTLMRLRMLAGQPAFLLACAMTTYPAAGDYYKAVQAPTRVFTVPKLQAAEFVWDSLGPTLARGSSAVVFQATVEGTSQALRCYIRNDASSSDRYRALAPTWPTHNLSPYVVGRHVAGRGHPGQQATWPVLTMDWIDGRTLNEYVDFLVTGSNAAALTTLAAKWRELVALLQNSEFTHGDLQHGNVMVDQAGRIRLVDFDGVWIPQLAGKSPPTEFGHPNYQHPMRHVWGRWLDTFSALVIYLSLTALGKDPALWLALYNSKNLLFAKNDFFPPFRTDVWKQLAAMGDPQVDELVRRLQECCDPDWVSTKSLEMILDQQAVTPARQPIPVEQRWWEKKPVAASGSAVGGSPAAGSPGGFRGGGLAGGFRGGRLRGGGFGGGFRGGGFGGGGFGGRRVGFAAVVPGGAAGAGRDREDRGGFPASAASAVRAARYGGYRTDAATEPDDGASGRHHLVVRTGIGVLCTGPGPDRRPTGPCHLGPCPRDPYPWDPCPWDPCHPGPCHPRRERPCRERPSVPGAPVPGASAPAPPAPATKPQPGPVVGAIALGLGIVLLIIGAVSHVSIIVIGGLVAAAWGIWRLVTGTGPERKTKPPGQT